MNILPAIGITMGDPSGIGPEITIKALSSRKIYEVCRPLIIGDPEALLREIGLAEEYSIKEISSPVEAEGIPGQLDMIACSRLSAEDMAPGKPSVNGGKAMVQYILKAVEMALNRDIAAIVTNPINKALMNKAGYHYEGHTQLISKLTNTEDYIMMLAGERLRVTLVTIHCPLKEVPSLINENNILKTISITYRSLKEDFGIENPRIAVAALNPHGGEEELFGTEEKDIIVPAVNKANVQGLNVTGPLPADTLYHKAASGNFDAVVNMYHDQGLIPLKLLHFSDAVNITLGLPIIRTSVDHGTAYDIAGKGEADPGSLISAIETAVKIFKNRSAAKGYN